MREGRWHVRLGHSVRGKTLGTPGPRQSRAASGGLRAHAWHGNDRLEPESDGGGGSRGRLPSGRAPRAVQGRRLSDDPCAIVGPHARPRRCQELGLMKPHRLSRSTPRAARSSTSGPVRGPQGEAHCRRRPRRLFERAAAPGRSDPHPRQRHSAAAPRLRFRRKLSLHVWRWLGSGRRLPGGQAGACVERARRKEAIN